MNFQIANVEGYDAARCFVAWKEACSAFRPELTSSPGQLTASTFLTAITRAKEDYALPFLLLRDAQIRSIVELGRWLHHTEDFTELDLLEAGREFEPTPIDFNADTSGSLWMLRYTIEECPLKPTIEISLMTQEKRLTCIELELQVDDDALDKMNPLSGVIDPQFLEESTGTLLRAIHNKLVTGSGFIAHIVEGKKPLPQAQLMTVATFAPARSLIGLVEDRVTQ